MYFILHAYLIVLAFLACLKCKYRCLEKITLSCYIASGVCNDHQQAAVSSTFDVVFKLQNPIPWNLSDLRVFGASILFHI